MGVAAVFAVLVLLACACNGAAATTKGAQARRIAITFISDADGLVAIFDGNQFAGTILTLNADIDFSEATTPLTAPLGTKESGECVAFSGGFIGNDHIIINLKMNNTDVNGVGLFCGLDGATVSNLHIDSSCSFVGKSGGALAAEGYGTLRYVHNHATVECQEYYCGGLIGTARSSGESELTVTGCSNTGSVTSTSINDQGSAGGLFGMITVEISAVRLQGNTNSGTISCPNSGCYAGGLVGGSHCKSVTMEDNTNNGNVACTGTGNCKVGTTNDQSSCAAGGIFGWAVSSTINTTNDTNNGDVKCTGANSFVGGFIGNQAGGTLTVDRFSNNGKITTTGCQTACGAGGVSGACTDTLTTNISNTMNTGKVLAMSSSPTQSNVVAGGLVGGNTGENNPNIDVWNSVNHGMVSSNGVSCGIALVVVSAHNVVSLRSASGYESYSTWQAPCSGGSCTQVFVGFDVCGGNKQCTENDAISISWNTSTLAYYRVNGDTGEPFGDRVDVLLNNQAAQESDNSKQWTRSLALFDSMVNVTFGQPASVKVQVGAGESFGITVEDAQRFLDGMGSGIQLADFHFVDNESRAEVLREDPVGQNMSVLLCHVVDVVGDVPAQRVLIEHGALMDSSDVLAQILADGSAGVLDVVCTNTETGAVDDCFAAVVTDVTLNATNITQQQSSSSSVMSSWTPSSSSSSTVSEIQSLTTSWSATNPSNSSAPQTKSSSTATSSNNMVDVEIKFDGSVNINTIEQDIKDAIVDVVGGNVDVVIVDVVTDDQGNVVSVIVRVDDKTANTIADVVNNNKDKCAGVLCRATEATLTGPASPSTASKLSTLIAILIVLLLVGWH